MDLKSFIAESGRGASAKLARKIGVSPVMVSQWAKDVKPIPAERCLEIQHATAGVVTCVELRPDLPWPTRAPKVPAQEAA